MSKQHKECPECGRGIMPHRTMCIGCELTLIKRATTLAKAGVVVPNRSGVLRDRDRR